jgi:tetratricopeptide (TPR) repeat protein
MTKIKRLFPIAMFLLMSYVTHSQSTIISYHPKMEQDTIRFNKYISTCNKVVKGVLLEANKELDNRKYRNAAGKYDVLLGRDSVAYLFRKCGEAHLSMTHYEKAIIYFNKAIALDNLYSQAYVSKIKALEKLGRKDDVQPVLMRMDEIITDDEFLTAMLISKGAYPKYSMLMASRRVRLAKLQYKRVDYNSLSLYRGLRYDFISSLTKDDLKKNRDLTTCVSEKYSKLDSTASIHVNTLFKNNPNSIAISKLYFLSADSLTRNPLVKRIILDLEKKKAISLWQYWKFADALAKDGDHVSAIKYYSKALALNSDISIVHYKRSLEYRKTASYWLAYKDADAAVRKDSLNADFVSNRGFVHVILGNKENSLADARCALKLDNDNKNANLLAAIIYEKECVYDKALHYTDRLLEITPDDKEVYYRRARLFQRIQDYDSAKKQCRLVLAKDEDDYRALSDLRNICRIRLDFEEAIETHKVIMKFFPERTDNNKLLLDFYSDAKLFDKAFEYAESLLSEKKVDWDAIKTLIHISSAVPNKTVRAKANKIMSNPKYDRALMYLTKAHILAYSSPKVAVRCIDRAHSFGVKLFDFIVFRFDCYKRAYGKKAYKKELDKFLIKYPSRPELLAMKGIYLCENNDILAGLKLVRRNMSLCNISAPFSRFLIREYFDNEISPAYIEDFYRHQLKKAVKAEDLLFLKIQMADFYVSNRNFKKAMSVAWQVKKLHLSIEMKPYQNPYVESETFVTITSDDFFNKIRLDIYDYSFDFNRWMNLKMKLAKYDPYVPVDEQLIVDLASRGLFKESSDLLRGSLPNRFFWLESLGLMKNKQEKKAEILFKSIVKDYKHDELFLVQLHNDFTYLLEGLKSRRQRYYVRKILKELIKPLL